MPAERQMAVAVGVPKGLLFPNIISQETNNREDEQAEIEDGVCPKMRRQVLVLHGEMKRRGDNGVQR